MEPIRLFHTKAVMSSYQTNQNRSAPPSPQLVSSIVGLFGIYGGFGLILQLLRTYRREEIRLGRFLWRAGRAGVGRMAANASVRRLELSARRSVQAGPSLVAAAAPAEVDGDAPASALKLSAGREHADSVDVDGPRL